MELNRDQIVKALECCLTVEFGGDCPFDCPYAYNDDCENFIFSNALTLIKELSEENAKLARSCAELERSCTKLETLYKIESKRVDTVKADTVRKMQERLKEAPIKVGLPLFGLQTKDEIEDYANDIILQMRDAIDQIAKEMLEGEK